MVFNPMFEACVFTLAKRKREMDIRREEISIAYLRPTRGTRISAAPRETPRRPGV